MTFLLRAVDYHLPDAGAENEQPDAADSEIFCDGPQEDEQTDAQADVFDAFVACVVICTLFEETLG